MNPTPVRRLGLQGGRLIVVGDIHGCYDGLQELLARLAPSDADVVVAAGDIVRKGPDPVRCVQLWLDRGYHAVRGNNEEKILELSGTRLRKFILPRADRRLMARSDLIESIRAWPLVIDFSTEKISVVHGGILPGMSVDEAAHDKAVATSLRYIRYEDGRWVRVPKGKDRAFDALWPTVYRGDRLLLYGHTPLERPRIDPNAIGLDTGCVYGGELTAAVFALGAWTFTAVKARRAYARR